MSGKLDRGDGFLRRGAYADIRALGLLAAYEHDASWR
jgi:hypothetical protein